MAEYLILGNWDPRIIEAKDWEEAVMRATGYCGNENVFSITKTGSEEDENN